MFTSIDKALVAAFGAIVYLAQAFGGVNIGISNETFATIMAAAMPILVYLVPNKPWTEK